jgi:hypothetical protein
VGQLEFGPCGIDAAHRRHKNKHPSTTANAQWPRGLRIFVAPSIFITQFYTGATPK